MPASCDKCKHWRQDTVHSKKGIGECRRYPPIRREMTSTFPLTVSYDYCGEYEYLPNKDKTE